MRTLWYEETRSLKRTKKMEKRLPTLFVLQMYGMEIDISREDARKMLEHAYNTNQLTLIERSKGYWCWQLGRTSLLKRPAFITMEV